MSAARVVRRPDEVGIVPTGVANLEAVAAAFRRLGRTPRPLDSAAGIARARYVVLPGVGSFEGGMAEIRRRGWAEAIRRRVEEGRPTLGICLGLQLLCDGSDEAPGVPGLGCIPGRVVRLEGAGRVPQLGWNRLSAPGDSVFLRSGVVYFANSYRLETAPSGWSAARSWHGNRFVAGLERAGVLACQFHPELSGRVGAALLTRWLERSPTAAAAAAAASSPDPERVAAAC